MIQFYMEPWNPGDEPNPGVFCQWAPTPIIIEMVQYPTAEHFMMAEKAALFRDSEILERIMQTNDPGTAKMLGRMVRGFDLQQWSQHRFATVVRGNHAKFTQHPQLGEYLLGTGSQVIVEASSQDRVWGVGRLVGQADNPFLWGGDNLLGFALMTVREMMR